MRGRASDARILTRSSARDARALSRHRARVAPSSSPSRSRSLARLRHDRSGRAAACRRRRRCRAPPSRRRRRSTCPASRCRTGKATRTAARAPPAPQRRDAARYSADAQLPHRLDRRHRAVQEQVSRRTRRARALKPARSQAVDLRGARAPRADLGRRRTRRSCSCVHGWMDVAASFQFLVDALARERHVIAPDLRGYGGSAWQPQGYWFADYVADLEALRRRTSRRARPSTSRATASAATSR